MNRSGLDIAANRASARYSPTENLRRVAWTLVWPLFRLSPRPFFGWRRFLLRLMGATVGRHVHVYPSAAIEMPWNLEVGDWSSIGEHAIVYSLGRIALGARVTISQRAHLCAGSHDYRRRDMPLLKPPIRVGDEAWVCADAFIGPGVTVGEGAVVGARAVAIRDVGAWDVVAGNPARRVSRRVLESPTAPVDPPTR